MGLVVMKAGEDARTRTIHLTRRGTNAFRRAAPLWYDIQSMLLEKLGPGYDQLKQLLGALTAQPPLESA